MVTPPSLTSLPIFLVALKLLGGSGEDDTAEEVGAVVNRFGASERDNRSFFSFLLLLLRQLWASESEREVMLLEDDGGNVEDEE